MNESHDPLRMLFVTWMYFPEIGGVPTHVHEVTTRLAAKGVDITVLTTDRSGQLAADEELEGVRILRVPARPRGSDLFFSPGMWSVIQNGSWDLMHSQGYQTLVPPLAMLAASRAQVPFLLTLHPGGNSSLFHKAIKVIQWRFLRPLVSRAERLVATARWEKDFFAERMQIPLEKFVIIPNGGTLPSANGKCRANPRYGKLIVSVGRLERYKGHHRVIAALPTVLQEVPDLKLKILGNGPYKDALINLAHRLGLSDTVEISSFPPEDRDAMALVLRRASLMTLLSQYEGHPMSVMEALAMGCPVLVSDHPGLAEFAARGFARSVSTKSTSAEVAVAILEQLRNPLIPTSFELPTWDHCADALYDLYKEVLGRA